MTDPHEELSGEDVLLLLGACPERVTDIAAGLDEARLRYRHGPAFPTLKEVIAHLSTAGVAVDALLRRAHLDHAEEADVLAAIDPPNEPPGSETAPEELLADYVRVRRRTIDLLRGWSDAEWARRLRDPKLGNLTLLEVGRKVAAHEIGHLTQLRNLISLVPEPTDLGEVVANRLLTRPLAPAPAEPEQEPDGQEPAGS
jgi:hypothetical protein